MDTNFARDSIIPVNILFNIFSVQKYALLKRHVKNKANNWKVGDSVNIERAMKMGARLDGHMVQGHVDQIAVCESITEENGSWYFKFSYKGSENITIEKGSIAINGVSLTVVDSKKESFSVAIIPYTYDHTNFKFLKIGDCVNIEFDMIGKYISKIISSSSN